jgi:hypothetical protein
MLERLMKAFPAIAPERLNALAEIWSLERDQIIGRMLEICRNDNGPVMARAARPEAIFQLANLIVWLEERIIAKNLESRSIEEIDLEVEQNGVGLPTARERIENTARVCAERIWQPSVPLFQTNLKSLHEPLPWRSRAVLGSERTALRR